MIYRNYPIDKYHAEKSLGSSSIKMYLENPEEFEYYYVLGNKFEETDSMRFGKIAHEFMLENDKFMKEYAIIDCKTKADKIWKSCTSKKITKNEYKKLKSMYASLCKKEVFLDLLKFAEIEVSFFTEHDGVPLKARPDAIIFSDKEIIILDYKTTNVSLSVRKQSNNLFDVGRHIQAAIHSYVVEKCTGKKVSAVYYITQMSAEPYTVRIFKMNDEIIDYGRKEAFIAIEEIKNSLEKNDFTAFKDIEEYIIPKHIETFY